MRRAIAAAAVAGAALAGRALASQNESGEEVCRPDVQLDVVFALDTTASMGPYLTAMRRNLPELLRGFERQYPGSHFGFATFNDKRTHCQRPNDWGNYCNRLDLPLTGNVSAVERQLRNARADNGDLVLPEDPLGLIVVAAQHPTMGWRDVAADSEMVSKKVLIIVTDADYKRPGDAVYCPSPGFRANDGDWDYDCDGEDFPSEEQARVALQRKDIHVLFMTAQSAVRSYNRLFTNGWQNRIKGSVFLISQDASNLIDAVESSIEDIVCNNGNGSGSTVPPPVTVPTTAPGNGGDGGGDGGHGDSDDGGDGGGDGGSDGGSGGGGDGGPGDGGPGDGGSGDDDDNGVAVVPIVAGAAGGLAALAAAAASVTYYRRTGPVPVNALDLAEVEVEEPSDPDREANIQVSEDYYG